LKGYLVLALACFLGTTLGLLTAQQAVGGRYGIASQTQGPWTVWPSALQPRIDPYTRAHHVAYALLPSNRFETLEYEARTDSTGRPLDANCTYEVAGPMPAARWWSMQVLSAEDQSSATTATSNGLIAQQVVYEPDGTFRIVLSSDPQPGNWIQPVERGRLVMLLRFYSPAPALRRSPLSGTLPAVERQVCR
jgi:hypothetical protein